MRQTLQDSQETVMPSLFTDLQRAAYERDGFVVIRSLFDQVEIGLLRDAIETDPQLRESLYDRHDASGKSTRMATWNHPGDSVYGLAARTHRVVDTMEDMLGGEVYHYHSKLTAKEPRVGGAWEWHQDYGYWYHNGCMFPYMASVMVALDKTTRENGCLQVLRGSHVAGRVDHGVLPGEQVGANAQDHGVGVCRTRPRRRFVFSCELDAPLRPKQLRPKTVDGFVLLQRCPQQPLLRTPPSAVHAVGQSQ
jgi:hypothetical protein